MTVLGIDPGIAHTGYGFIEADSSTLTVLDFGSIHTAPKVESASRLKMIYDALVEKVSQYQPDFFVFEAFGQAHRDYIRV